MLIYNDHTAGVAVENSTETKEKRVVVQREKVWCRDMNPFLHHA